MSRKYKFRNPEALYFVTFATVNWIDVFTRRDYKDIMVDRLNYCIANKGLVVYAWVVMTNHVHLVIERKGDNLEDVLRDMKKHTAKSIINAIKENPQESRKESMLWMFERAGSKNSHNKTYQFWQQHNQPIELMRKAFDIDNTIDYIHFNPVKAGFVERQEDFPYSSARDFSGTKGLVNIESC